MFESVRKTKVRDYHVLVLIEQEASEFEVAMDDLFLVDIPDAGDKLAEQFARILLLEITVGKDMVKKFTAGRVLENDANVLVRLDDIVKSDDVGVFESLKGEPDVSPPEMFQRDRTKRREHTLRTSISRSTFDMRAEVSMFPLRISFTATSSPHCIWRPSLTLPNSPSPRV